MRVVAGVGWRCVEQATKCRDAQPITCAKDEMWWCLQHSRDDRGRTRYQITGGNRRVYNDEVQAK